MDFLTCFQLEVTRIGEICNACVLLVKRWKKLPMGDDRHWAHMVDARVGTGTNSVKKMKKKEIAAMQEEQDIKKKHVYKRNKKRVIKKYEIPGIISNLVVDMTSFSGGRRTKKPPKKIPTSATTEKDWEPGFSSFVDLTYWKRKDICCGMIYEGLAGEVMIDQKIFSPCSPKTQAGEKNKTNGEKSKPSPPSQTLASVIESELRKFGYEESEEEIDDDEEFYSDAANKASNNGAATVTDIDEGFCDKAPKGFKYEEESSHSFKFGLNNSREGSCD